MKRNTRSRKTQSPDHQRIGMTVARNRYDGSMVEAECLVAGCSAGGSQVNGYDDNVE